MGKYSHGGIGGGMGRLGQQCDRDFASPTLGEALKEHVCTSIAIGPGNTGATTKEFKAFVWGAGSRSAATQRDANTHADVSSRKT